MMATIIEEGVGGSLKLYCFLDNLCCHLQQMNVSPLRFDSRTCLFAALIVQNGSDELRSPRPQVNSPTG